jgi:hypothetical protein
MYCPVGDVALNAKPPQQRWPVDRQAVVAHNMVHRQLACLHDKDVQLCRRSAL